jgi:hypothetical protein
MNILLVRGEEIIENLRGNYHISDGNPLGRNSMNCNVTSDYIVTRILQVMNGFMLVVKLLEFLRLLENVNCMHGEKNV